MTQPAEYVPYPADSSECENCAVHSGFMYLWNAARENLVPVVQGLVDSHPDYQLVLTGHSLGGAIAGLAALEFAAKGWDPAITTFGEPRFGNKELAAYVDRMLVKKGEGYHRVTHAGDPVPLLPFDKWGWRMHAGEIYIGKDALPIERDNVHRCDGPNDPSCIQGPSNAEGLDGMSFLNWSGDLLKQAMPDIDAAGIPGLPAEWRLWEILFAHRQYFWRLGLCWDSQDYEYPKRPDDASDEL
jgi:Lipase (class 3)